MNGTREFPCGRKLVWAKRGIRMVASATLALWGCTDHSPLPTSTVAFGPRMDGSPGSPIIINVSSAADLRSAIANATPYTRIQLAAGIYDLGDSEIVIQDKKNLEIFGAGRGATIVQLGPGAAFGFNLAGTNETLDVAHFTIRGTQPSSVKTHGFASGPNRFSLKALVVRDMEVRDVGVGISVIGSGNGVCNDVAIVDNYLDNITDFVVDGVTSGSGYGIHNQGCTAVRIADNEIRDADRHSIYQSEGYQPGRTGPGKIEIEHNLIVNHAKSASIDATYLVALNVSRSSNVVVANNVIVDPYRDAISIENPQGEGQSYTVENVRLINNTILGARQQDVFLTAANSHTSWGNRAAKRNSFRMVDSLTVRRDGYGFNGSLVEPAAWPGTKAISSENPYAYTFVFQNYVLHRATTTYNEDPTNWPKTWNGNLLWTGFSDMVAANGRAYMLANGTLSEVDPVNWTSAPAPFVYSDPNAMMAFSGGYLFVFHDGNLFDRIVPGSWIRETRSFVGTTNGISAFRNRVYLMADNCFYEIDSQDLTFTTLGC